MWGEEAMFYKHFARQLVLSEGEKQTKKEKWWGRGVACSQASPFIASIYLAFMLSTFGTVLEALGKHCNLYAGFQALALGIACVPSIASHLQSIDLGSLLP